MKIVKRSITACDMVEVVPVVDTSVIDTPVVDTQVVVPEPPVGTDVEFVSPVVESTSYQKAIDCIYEAIQSLGEIASSDLIARDAIANLSVVLFDLKG